MSRLVTIAAAALAASACAGCAAVGPVEDAQLPANLSTERQCFLASTINGYSEAPDGPRGRDRLYIKTGVNERWLVEPIGVCRELDWSTSIALDRRGVGSLCTGHTATLLVPDRTMGGVERCSVRVLGRLVGPE